MSRSCYVGPGLACNAHDDRYRISKRLQFISRCIREEGNLYILDIGTGYGVYRSALLPQAARYIGIDVNLSGLRQARLDDETAELLLSSAEQLCFKDNLFDVALLIEVLEHIPDDTKALQEAYRVLKPGGIAIITAPNKRFPLETHPVVIRSKEIDTRGVGFPLLPYLPIAVRKHVADARVYSPEKFKKILAATGFVLSDVAFIGPTLEHLRINFPRPLMSKAVNNLSRLINKMERTPYVNTFLSTMVACCRKPEKRRVYTVSI
jgi:ubiquinone/menaquinone biosynthesis C-methylase UbiE